MLDGLILLWFVFRGIFKAIGAVLRLVFRGIACFLPKNWQSATRLPDVDPSCPGCGAYEITYGRRSGQYVCDHCGRRWWP